MLIGSFKSCLHCLCLLSRPTIMSYTCVIVFLMWLYIYTAPFPIILCQPVFFPVGFLCFNCMMLDCLTILAFAWPILRPVCWSETLPVTWPLFVPAVLLPLPGLNLLNLSVLVSPKLDFNQSENLSQRFNIQEHAFYFPIFWDIALERLIVRSLCITGLLVSCGSIRFHLDYQRLSGQIGWECRENAGVQHCFYICTHQHNINLYWLPTDEAGCLNHLSELQFFLTYLRSASSFKFLWKTGAGIIYLLLFCIISWPNKISNVSFIPPAVVKLNLAAIQCWLKFN